MMDNGMMRKYEKAKMYAEQPERMSVESLVVQFDGRNNPHTVNLADGVWQCDCDFFVGRERCAHTMALELVMSDLIEAPAVA
jgi:hypothetical protein